MQQQPPPSRQQIASVLRGLSVHVHEVAVKRGYYLGGVRNVGESLMQATRELTHAANDVRKSRKLSEIQRAANGKPRGFPIAVARCVIRLADLCEYVGVDLGAAISTELEYSERRAKK